MGAMAATRGHTTPAHAALAHRRAHAAFYYTTAAGPSGARRGTGRARHLDPPRFPPRAPTLNPRPPCAAFRCARRRPEPCPLKIQRSLYDFITYYPDQYYDNILRVIFAVEKGNKGNKVGAALTRDAAAACNLVAPLTGPRTSRGCQVTVITGTILN
ncbi:unnamed protein product [Parnassius apollo]|uniref:(apollo) hypothetical protein n=1 Tax=Parnassius apollo TaxID=110799 RepID=A0A8S3WTK8_PARAO|nr:unnamed protein product [Parnassius apollo]